jgi:hypothetical protein
MAQKVLFTALAGLFAVALAGVAAAESPVTAADEARGLQLFYTAEMPGPQQAADPERQYSNPGPWLERGPVETGSAPAMREGTGEPACCAPSVEAEGNTVIRHGIDDGP